MDDSSDDDVTILSAPITGVKRKRVILTNSNKRRKIEPQYLASSSKIWFLTWNNYDEEWVMVLSMLDGLVQWCCQEETGESGNKHIQGVLRFRREYTGRELHECVHGIHWEPCRNLVSAKKYCLKLKTRTGRTWVSGFRVPLVVKDPLEGKDLYQFQKDIISLVKEEPDLRQIHWYWSRKGNIGKSSLCKHICLKYAAIALGGKVSDAMYAVAKLVEAGKPPTVVIFDVARSDLHNLNYVSLENLKNGCFFNGKYESAMVLMNPPHVIVFANEGPNENMLSEDRWVVRNLDSDIDLPGGGVDEPIEIS